MLKEYLSTLANRFRIILGTTEPINAQSFEGEIENVFNKGHSTGLLIGRQEGYQEGYAQGDADGRVIGYNSAVKTGTITFTGASKILSISGLPSEPKEVHLFGLNAHNPTNDNDAFIGALNYLKDSFSYGTSTAKISVALWMRTNAGAANGSVAEKIATNNNVLTYENGTFTIDLSYHTRYCFGENYTYRWTAIF